MKKLIAGNWKMNGHLMSTQLLAADINVRIKDNPDLLKRCDFLICPSFLHISVIMNDIQNISVGGQDCSEQDDGAYTGQVSARMLSDIGCHSVILGHSERRQYQRENSDLIQKKMQKAHQAKLRTIICVGETEKEREDGKAENIVGEQLEKSLAEGYNQDNTVIAYEPVWAIGTGKIPTIDDIEKMHNFIRVRLNNKDIPILYGGSVKPDNAKDIFAVANVNGALIGGASLNAEDFIKIAEAA